MLSRTKEKVLFVKILINSCMREIYRVEIRISKNSSAARLYAANKFKTGATIKI